MLKKKLLLQKIEDNICYSTAACFFVFCVIEQFRFTEMKI